MWRKISNHKLITVAFLLGLCIVNGCVVSQQDTVSRRVNYDPYPSCLITNKLKVVVPPVADYVILSRQLVRESQDYPSGFWPLWNPDTNLVLEVLNQIPSYAERITKQHLVPECLPKFPGLVPMLPKSICQIVGVTYNERRALVLNFVPLEYTQIYEKNWRERFIRTVEQGPGFWRVVYLLEDKKFTNLHISHYGY